MDRVMVTYKVKSDRVDENENLIKAVYRELEQINDQGIHYATFRLEDGQTFVHIASFDSTENKQKFSQSEAFNKFQQDIKDRCEIPPKPEPLSEVGSFNF